MRKRQEILKAGLTGYKRKLARSLSAIDGIKHALGAPGLEDRRIGKVLDLSRWFKKISKGDTRVAGDCQSGGQSSSKSSRRKSPVTVLFVPRTPGGGTNKENQTEGEGDLKGDWRLNKGG